MKCNSQYGRETVPKFRKVARKAHCPFCPDAKNLSKNDEAVYIAVNGGPTGGVFMCKEHAGQLAKELNELLECKLGRPEIDDPWAD